MKVLIADDVHSNRQVLIKALESHPGTYIQEAENGQIAVDLCQKEQFDIIFMDVMMPIMDGIEATKKIREIDEGAVIVAVSSLGDEHTVREMLKAGAEDYLIKPVNMKIMRHRLRNYAKIARFRKFSTFGTKKINLFNEEVYSRLTLFRIHSETSLIEFWEYFLDVREQANVELQLCSAVQTIFDLGSILIARDNKLSVCLENNDVYKYFTLVGIDSINKKIIEEMIEFNFAAYNAGCKYRFEGSKLTIRIEQDETRSNVHYLDDEEEEEGIYGEPYEGTSLLIDSFLEVVKPAQKEICDFIPKQTLKDLERSIELLASSNNAQELSDEYEAVSFVLSQYCTTFDISIALRSLGLDIKDVGKIEYLDAFKALGATLQRWYSELFVGGIDNPNRFDSRIIKEALAASKSLKA